MRDDILPGSPPPWAPIGVVRRNSAIQYYYVGRHFSKLRSDKDVWARDGTRELQYAAGQSNNPERSSLSRSGLPADVNPPPLPEPQLPGLLVFPVWEAVLCCEWIFATTLPASASIPGFKAPLGELHDFADGPFQQTQP